ncbi:hypothetical protein Tco_0268446 [Tanacetum coccineum]
MIHEYQQSPEKVSYQSEGWWLRMEHDIRDPPTHLYVAWIQAANTRHRGKMAANESSTISHRKENTLDWGDMMTYSSHPDLQVRIKQATKGSGPIICIDWEQPKADPSPCLQGPHHTTNAGPRQQGPRPIRGRRSHPDEKTPVT